MKLLPSFSLFLLFGLTFCSSEDPQPCLEPPEDIWSMKLSVFGEYANCTLKNLDPNKNKMNVIVQSLEQFDSSYGCSIPNHKINFSFYTVLAGRLKTPGGGRVLKQWVTKECSNIILHVEIGWGSGTALGDVFYNAVIDKIPDSQNVFFDIKVLDCPGSNSINPEVIPYTIFSNGLYCGLALPVENPEVINHSFKIIDNLADYEQFFFCGYGDPLPEIDFNLQTIFTARVVTTTLDLATDQSVLKKCDQYLYSVKLSEVVITEGQSFTFYVIVPKISDDTKVFFDFQFR